MNLTTSWLAAPLAVAARLLYEASLAVARTAHANLRRGWFEAVSAEKDSEIRAVQTLRNALMPAPVPASTAALWPMGSATRAAPPLHAELIITAVAFAVFAPRLTKELVLLVLLFDSKSNSLFCKPARLHDMASFPKNEKPRQISYF